MRSKSKKRKNKRKKKAAPYSRKIGSFFFAMFCVVATMAVAGLAFVSPHMALIAAGLAVISLLLFMDQRRRGFWEQSIGFQVQEVRKAQDELTRNVMRNRNDISSLREDISDVSLETDKMNKSLQTFSKMQKPARANKDSSVPNLNHLKDKLSDIAAKPRASSMTKDQRFATYQNLLSEPVSFTNDEPQYSKTVIKSLVMHAVKHRDLEMFVQPIVALPQRKTRFYELYARVRAKSGHYIPAAQFLPLAKEERIDGEIDNLLLIECLKVMRASAHIKNVTPFFVNITRATLSNKVFMNRLLTFIAKNRSLAPRLIFEIPEYQYKNLPSSLHKVLGGLGQLGCGFALSGVQSLDVNVRALMVAKVRYLKLDKDVLRRMIETNAGLVETVKRKRMLEGNGVGVIAEKLETENDLRRLMDLDMNFGQGYLFGRPDLQGAYTNTQAA